MTKFTKRIAAMGAAVMMAVSMMSMETSAVTSANWTLYNYSGGSNDYHEVINLTSSSSRNKIKESCTKFSSSSSSTYVNLHTYGVDNSGNVAFGYNLSPINGSNILKISSTHSTKNRSLLNTASAAITIKACYDMYSAGSYTEIKGSISN